MEVGVAWRSGVEWIDLDLKTRIVDRSTNKKMKMKIGMKMVEENTIGYIILYASISREDGQKHISLDLDILWNILWVEHTAGSGLGIYSGEPPMTTCGESKEEKRSLDCLILI